MDWRTSMSGTGVSWAASPWPTLLQVRNKTLCHVRSFLTQVIASGCLTSARACAHCPLLMHVGNYPRQMGVTSWDAAFVGSKSWRNMMCWCYWLCCHGQCHHPSPSPAWLRAPATVQSNPGKNVKLSCKICWMFDDWYDCFLFQVVFSLFSASSVCSPPASAPTPGPTAIP